MNINNIHPIKIQKYQNLPQVVYTLAGVKFSPYDYRWELNDGSLKVILNFRRLNASEEIINSVKTALVWYAENHSLSHLRNMFYHLRNFIEFIAIKVGIVTEMTSLDVINFKADRGPAREWHVGALAVILKKIYGLGLKGVAPDVPQLLEKITLKGNEKGVATATMDPFKGPFTAVEMEGIQIALNRAYAEKKFGHGDYVLSWQVVAFGQRPKQYAALKVCDIRRQSLKDGSYEYVIFIPRAKQQGIGIREEFKERVLSPELGKLTYDYAQLVLKKFAGIMENPEQAPLFPSKVDQGVSGFEYHHSARGLAQSFISALKSLRVYSERTGDLLEVNPRRFRQTIGTRAAEEGHGPLIIAEILDHSDIQNVQVYVGSTTAMAQRIDKAMAIHIAPLAQAFAGKLVVDGTRASRPFDPMNVIRAPEITNSFAQMSSCGKNGFCAFNKPIACYTCSSFEPWLDGPHEEILAYLLKERERMMSIDSRIAVINDRTIFAIAQVILLCKSIHVEKDV